MDEVLESVWSQLARATADAKHDFRKLWLATTDAEGKPQVRVVILRAFVKKERSLAIYTDPRTPKWQEIRERPWVQVNLWDSKASVQLRCDCMAELLESGEEWEAARQSLPEHVAGDYTAVKIPGEAIDAPEEGWELGESWNFGVVKLRIQKMDWLKLSREGHQRACFSWANGSEDFTWRQP